MTNIQQSHSVTTLLNQQIANWTLLYTKLHHFHWHVKGRDFFTLHSQFEALYKEAAERLDTLAERQLALGERPVSTLRESLQLASIQEAAGGETAEQMVAAVAADYRVIVEELRQGITIAQTAGDEPTADLFIGQMSELQKTLWMLNAFLGK